MPTSRLGLATGAASVFVIGLAGCGGSRPPAGENPAPGGYNGGNASVSRAADHAMIAIGAGPYFAGSTPEERQEAYADYRTTAGHDAAREGNWFEREGERRRESLPAYRIDLTPVTNAAYHEFVADTGAPAPQVDRDTWQSYGFSQDYDDEVARFNWVDGRPPEGREDHPVVLVTWDQASSYCRWRGAVMGEARQLPTAAEYEKAARGERGYVYPWGNEWDPGKLNSAVDGPRDTVAAGSYPAGASPFGMLDAAGNVFEWTGTPWPHGKNQMTVKGSAWEDYAGVGRGASQHGRPKNIRHAIIGFRCAADA